MRMQVNNPTYRPWLYPLLLAIAALTACSVDSDSPQGGFGERKKVYKVAAEYRGLEGHSVGVLVSANDVTLLYSPNAPELVAKQISADLQAHVTGIRLADPKQLAEFSERNPYWSVTPFRDLLARLQVERLIVIELVEYRLRDADNSFMWRGYSLANVSVAAADAEDVERPVYQTQVRAFFPAGGRSPGMANVEPQIMDTGLSRALAEQVGGLFYDHEVMGK
ncbi:MAG: hypothetical protein IT443_03670 [Phycisphaeraceae bacterium]|nr:hypothetical protein [Phycisphaeraceae bacterium]